MERYFMTLGPTGPFNWAWHLIVTVLVLVQWMWLYIREQRRRREQQTFISALRLIVERSPVFSNDIKEAVDTMLSADDTRPVAR